MAAPAARYRDLTYSSCPYSKGLTRVLVPSRTHSQTRRSLGRADARNSGPPRWAVRPLRPARSAAVTSSAAGCRRASRLSRSPYSISVDAVNRPSTPGLLHSGCSASAPPRAGYIQTSETSCESGSRDRLYGVRPVRHAALLRRRAGRSAVDLTRAPQAVVLREREQQREQSPPRPDAPEHGRPMAARSADPCFHSPDDEKVSFDDALMSVRRLRNRGADVA